MEKACLVAPEWYRICLIRTRLAKDVAVSKALRKLSPAIQAYYAIGMCDIVAILRGDASERAFMTSGASPDIISVEELPCYALCCSDNDGASERVPLTALGSITFFRVDGHSADDGTGARFVREMTDDVRKKGGLALESLGGANYIVIRNCADLSDFAGWISRVIDNPCVVDSYSLILIGAEDWREHSQKPAAHFLGGLPHNSEVHARLVFAPGCVADPSVFRKLGNSDKLSVSLFHTSGGDDLTMVLRPTSAGVSLGDAIDQVEAVRCTGTEWLASTSTHIQFPFSPSHVRAPRASATRDFLLDKKHSEQITCLGHLGYQTARLLYAFGDALNDPFQREMISDMAPYYGVLLKKALEVSDRTTREAGPTSEHAEALRSLSELLHYCTQGIDQRLHGFKWGLRSTIPHTPWPLGGVSRAVSAAETVVNWVFDHLDAATGGGVGRKWNGFVLLGPHGDYAANASEIIQLPDSYLMSPARWMGIVHEAAHCFVFAHQGIATRISEIAARRPDQEEALQEFAADYIEYSFAPSKKLWHAEYWTYMLDKGLHASETRVAALSVIVADAIDGERKLSEAYTRIDKLYRKNAKAESAAPGNVWRYARTCFVDAIGNGPDKQRETIGPESTLQNQVDALAEALRGMISYLRKHGRDPSVSQGWKRSGEALEAAACASDRESCVLMSIADCPCPVLLVWFLWRAYGACELPVRVHAAFFRYVWALRDAAPVKWPGVARPQGSTTPTNGSAASGEQEAKLE